MSLNAEKTARSMGQLQTPFWVGAVGILGVLIGVVTIVRGIVTLISVNK